MKTFFAALLLLLTAAPCFSAEFTVEVKGKVLANNGRSQDAAPNVELKASADPLWGCKTQKELDRMAAKNNQEYPAVTVTGGGKSDAKGEFSFQIKIQVPEGKKLPKVNDGQNPPSWYDYVIVKVESAAEGYADIQDSWFLYVDKENIARNVYLHKIARVTGRLMSLSNMKPLANTTLLLRPKLLYVPKGQEVPVWKITTDAKGSFELKDPKVPVGVIELTLEDSTLAFAVNSKVWSGIQLQHGDNDLGNLMVVAGCTVKLRVVDSVKKGPVSVYIELKPTQGTLNLSEPAPDGVFEKSGIPEGAYDLKIVTGAYWGTALPHTMLKAGVNDLGTLEVDPVINLKVVMEADQGQLPERVTLSGFLLEGVAPEGAPRYNNDAHGTSTTTHRNEGYLSPLFEGRWFIRANATGWAPVWKIVDLPMEGNLKLTLSQGGSFELSMLDLEGKAQDIRSGAVAAIGTPAETWLRDGGDRSRRGTLDELGMMYDNGDGEVWKPGPLLPGKYFLRARSDMGLVQREFEIKAGEHLKLHLKPEPPRIEVDVTKGGNPASGEKLLLIVTDFMNRNAEEVVEASSDSSGKCVFELKKPTQVMVLLKREKEWIDAAPNQYEKQQRAGMLSERSFSVSYGSVIKLSIDVGGRERTWLTLDVALDKGWTIQGSGLTARLARSRKAGGTAVGTQDGNKVEFAMLRPGHYWLSLMLRDDTGQTCSFLTELHVEPKAEQTIKVKPKLNTVEVTVKLPKGAPEDGVSVYVSSVAQRVSEPRFYAGASEGKRGKYTVKGVPDGDYHVVVSARSADGAILYGSAAVSVSGNAKAKVTIDENQGAVDLEIRELQAGTLPQELNKTVRTTLLDKAGKEVLIGYPPSAVGQPGGMQLGGVPAGTYTLRIECTGCQPWQGEVTIKKNETTRLNADLAPATKLRLGIEGKHVAAVLAQDFTLKVEDAAGGALPGSEKNFDLFYFDAGEFGQPVLWITGLDVNAARVRLKFKGYKEAIVEVDSAKGSGQVLVLEAE
ncbi:MAG: PEGA domain-containing protein [Planctomycetes bacterium]|nr:PEGA domain-containing protein [Planctomycetota bacterium]MCB9936470.1 PEGA domain-containing protein [Planctomycetota bacterium]